MKEKILIVVMFGLLAGMVLVQSGTSFAQGRQSSMCEEALTVFRDVSRFGRKNSAAKNMTEKHAELALEGWMFADMEPYLENSDIEGFFLSYTRPVSCK